jgi:hypothetical protein
MTSKSKNPASKRDYQREDVREDTPAQVKHREERNKARAEATKRLGHSPKGDVAHIKPLDRGGRNISSNERVESVARNRGWRKGMKGYYVPDDVKKT